MQKTITLTPEAFIQRHVKKVAPLQKKAKVASWDAAVSGRPEDYERNKKLVLKIRRIYSNPDEFAYLKNLMESPKEGMSPVTARQVKILYNAYLTNQIDPALVKQMVTLSTEIEKNFSTFRGSKQILKKGNRPGWQANRSARSSPTMFSNSSD